MKELGNILKNTRQHLMNGVSHMIPVVVAGGILYAIAAMLSMGSVQESASVSSEGFVGVLKHRWCWIGTDGSRAFGIYC